jgi:hypothetical protein
MDIPERTARAKRAEISYFYANTFQASMQFVLRRIEQERCQATSLRPDLQHLGCEILRIGASTAQRDRPLREVP